ncbi:MAG TPA: CDP-alcohol phosphatidyltransferase family protein [Pseudomonadota bacterium]|jgi:CDP-diacylglycerol--glycerol-3-phosphate 3-phosphatidyltransferase|nr:CDP-alcohol phosphatidyltransferase family protein [Pseudomonadota bacterium]
MAKKPLVTANQVTLSRLLLLPIGAALLYGNKTALWVALVFMTIVGCTDFVDGWLARKYGSTELGRLMDPIADKVFVMVAFMPLIDLKWLVPWQVGLFLMREYVITGLRSAYERRHISPRTTLLAKIKAWAQMAGCGFLFFLQMLPERTMLIVLIVGTLLPLAFAVVRYAVQRYFWWGTFIFAGWVGVLLPPMWLSGRVATTDFLMLTVIGITWLSGWGYVAPSLPMILQRRFDLSDWVRILGGIVGPVLLILAFSRPELPHWVIMLVMGMELAVGGLDNLLCAHNAQSSALVWGLRAFGVALLAGLALWVPPAIGAWLLYGACAVATIGTAVEFYRGRTYYLTDVVESPAAA